MRCDKDKDGLNAPHTLISQIIGDVARFYGIRYQTLLLIVLRPRLYDACLLIPLMVEKCFKLNIVDGFVCETEAAIFSHFSRRID